MEEYNQLSEKTKDVKPTFHNFEGAALTLGQEFERRVLQAALEEEKKQQTRVKKMPQMSRGSPKSRIKEKDHIKRLRFGTIQKKQI